MAEKMKEPDYDGDEQKVAYEITSHNIRLQERTYRLDQLLADASVTRQKIKEHDDEKAKITRVLQKQIDDKNQQISQYQVRMQQLQHEAIDQEATIKETHDARKKELVRKTDAQVNDQMRKVEELTMKQELINDFQNTQKQKKSEIANEEERYKMLLRQLTEVEQQGKEDLKRQKLKHMYLSAQFDEEAKKNAQQKAEKNISEIERNIQAQNQRLEDEKLMQDQELEYLRNKIDEIAQDNEVFHEQLQSKSLTVEEHSKKQFEKARKIKLMKTKIELLEKSLGQIVSDFQKESELLKFQNEQVIREQETELRNLVESIRLKNSELKNLRALCQMVLDQRSDIEQFFLEAMEQVKEEKRMKLEEEFSKVQGPKHPDFLPLIEPGSKFDKKKNFESQHQQSSGMEQRKITVELTDLDWEDRETVLRLLFSKMNTGEPASNWRDPKSHSSAQSQQSTRDSGRHDAPNQGLNQAFMTENQEEDEDEDDEDLDFASENA